METAFRMDRARQVTSDSRARVASGARRGSIQIASRAQEFWQSSAKDLAWMATACGWHASRAVAHKGKAAGESEGLAISRLAMDVSELNANC